MAGDGPTDAELMGAVQEFTRLRWALLDLLLSVIVQETVKTVIRPSH